MTQPTLFTPPPADGRLGDRQQAVIDLLRKSADGRTADEIGSLLHTTCRYCAPGRPCRFARSDANGVLRSLRTLELARYRRNTGRWHATSGVTVTVTVTVAGSQGDFPEGF